jgi:hypothetical protein
MGREDSGRIGRGSAPEPIASLRNIIVFLLYRSGHRNAVDATRHDVDHPRKLNEVLSTTD